METSLDVSPLSASRGAHNGENPQLLSRIPKREAPVSTTLENGHSRGILSSHPNGSAVEPTAPSSTSSKLAQSVEPTLSLAASDASMKIPAWKENIGVSGSLDAVLQSIFFKDAALEELCADALDKKLTRTKDGGTQASQRLELIELTKSLRRCLRACKQREDTIQGLVAEELAKWVQARCGDCSADDAARLRTQLQIAEKALQQAEDRVYPPLPALQSS